MSKLKFNADWITEFKQRSMNPTETLAQLNVEAVKVMCWGVSKRVNMEDHGLLLKVNAMRLNGWVLITLAWDDTYTVRFFSTQFNQKDRLPMLTNVYCDELTSRIDDAIERRPEYTY